MAALCVALAMVAAHAVMGPRVALAAPAPVGPITLTIGGPAAAEVDARAVEVAVGEELGVTTSSAAAVPESGPTVEVEVATSSVVVRHRRPDGRRIERTVARPADIGDLPRVIARLAGNLVRDEAGELLDALAPAPAEPPASDAVATSPVEPTPGTSSADGATKVEAGVSEPDARAAESVAETPAAEAGGVGAPSAPTESDVGPKAPATPHACARGRDLPWEPAKLAFVDPLAILPLAGDRRTAFQLSALYGRTLVLCGAAVDGVVGYTDEATEGATFAGIWGHSGRAFRGARVAGVLGTDRADVWQGVAVAGVANVHLAPGEIPRHIGAEIAGIYNLAPDVGGQQIAGVFNDARDVEGAQIAGVVNRARHVLGAQIGLVNVAEDVRGTQIGLVNVAREVKGAAVAPFNLVEKGRRQVVAYTTNAEPLNTGLWFHVPPLVTSVAIGFAWGVEGTPAGSAPSATPAAEPGTFIVPQVGVAGRVPLDPLYVDIGAHYAPELDPSGELEERQTTRFRAHVGWDAAKPVGLFAGAGARYVVSHGDVTPEFSLGVTLF